MHAELDAVHAASSQTLLARTLTCGCSEGTPRFKHHMQHAALSSKHTTLGADRQVELVPGRMQCQRAFA